MSDFDKCVFNAREARFARREIDDATARVISSMYHDGQGSMSYSFTSTGAIVSKTAVYRECFPDHAALDEDEKVIADMFGTYLLNREHVGAVSGWSNLWV